MRRVLQATIVALALVFGCPSAMADPTIAPGVSAGGVDLSGLTAPQAEAKLAQALTPSISGPVIVGAGGRVFRLSAAQAGEKLDAAETVRRALAATAPGSVPVVLHHSRPAVRGFVIAAGRRVDRQPRSAWLQIQVRRLVRRAGRDGHVLDERGLERQIDTALDGFGTARIFHVHLRPIHPRIGLPQLRHAYPTVITVDRAHFKLRVFRFLRLIHTYGIAVGRSGLETPRGLYHVQEREVNPSWHVPNSSWAGSLAGKTIPPGPGDPIKARWLGLGGGVGIHGTAESFSIGSAASHGCIRMLIPNVIALYRITPVGTPVLIR